MTSTPGVLVDDNVLEVLRKAQLDEFTNKFIFVFNVTSFDHFSHVRDKDMQDIGMQHSQIRQLREQILKMSREMWNRSDPKQIYVQADQTTPISSEPPDIPSRVITRSQRLSLYKMIEIFVSTLDENDREKKRNELYSSIDPPPYQKNIRRRKMVEDINEQHCDSIETDNVIEDPHDNSQRIDFVMDRSVQTAAINAQDSFNPPNPYFSPQRPFLKYGGIEQDGYMRSTTGTELSKVSDCQSNELYESMNNPYQKLIKRRKFDGDITEQICHSMETDNVIENPRNNNQEIDYVMDTRIGTSNSPDSFSPRTALLQSGNSEKDGWTESTSVPDILENPEYKHLSIFVQPFYKTVPHVIDRNLDLFSKAVVEFEGKRQYIPIKRVIDRQYSLKHMPSKKGYYLFFAEATDGVLWNRCAREYTEAEVTPTICLFPQFHINEASGYVRMEVEKDISGSLSLELYGNGESAWNYPRSDNGTTHYFPYKLLSSGQFLIKIRLNGELRYCHSFESNCLESEELQSHGTTKIFAFQSFEKQFALNTMVTDSNGSQVQCQMKRNADQMLETIINRSMEIARIQWFHGESEINGGCFDFTTPMVEKVEYTTAESVNLENAIFPAEKIVKPRMTERALHDSKKAYDENNICEFFRPIIDKLLNIIPPNSVSPAQFHEALSHGQAALGSMSKMLHVLQSKPAFRVYYVNINEKSTDEMKRESVTEILLATGVFTDPPKVNILRTGKMAKSLSSFIEFTLDSHTECRLLKERIGTCTMSSALLMMFRKRYGNDAMKYPSLSNVHEETTDLVCNLLVRHVLGLIQHLDTYLWINDSEIFYKALPSLTFSQMQNNYWTEMWSFIGTLRGDVKNRAKQLMNR